MQLRYDKRKLNKFCKDNSISYLALFGSYARGEADEKSDVDLLVDFEEIPSLLKHVSLEYELAEKIFNTPKVDLVRKGMVNKYIEPYVNRDLVTLYE